MIIYLAGPMTGKPNWNKEAFEEAELRLCADGHTVFNPAKTTPFITPERVPHESYMKIAFAMIDCCEVICLLDGWGQSKGAKLEVEYAYRTGKKLGVLK